MPVLKASPRVRVSSAVGSMSGPVTKTTARATARDKEYPVGNVGSLREDLVVRREEDSDDSKVFKISSLLGCHNSSNVASVQQCRVVKNDWVFSLAMIDWSSFCSSPRAVRVPFTSTVSRENTVSLSVDSEPHLDMRFPVDLVNLQGNRTNTGCNKQWRGIVIRNGMCSWVTS